MFVILGGRSTERGSNRIWCQTDQVWWFKESETNQRNQSCYDRHQSCTGW